MSKAMLAEMSTSVTDEKSGLGRQRPQSIAQGGDPPPGSRHWYERFTSRTVDARNALSRPLQRSPAETLAASQSSSGAPAACGRLLVTSYQVLLPSLWVRVVR